MLKQEKTASNQENPADYPAPKIQIKTEQATDEKVKREISKRSYYTIFHDVKQNKLLNQFLNLHLFIFLIQRKDYNNKMHKLLKCDFPC